MAPKPKDLTGRVFTYLTARQYVKKFDGKRNRSYWECDCICGNIVYAASADLTAGKTKSCGCYNREITRKRMTKHGDAGTRLYMCYMDMKKRAKARVNCNIHEDFSTYEKFKAWSLENGYTDSLVLCRNKDTGDYSPCNARWDTQANNVIEALAGTYTLLTPEGETITITNMNKFCKDNNLDNGHMSEVVNNKRPTHKGYRNGK